MREYTKISIKFWTEIVTREMKSLGSDLIVIALYVQSCKHANMIGVYHLPLPYICYDTGISEDNVLAGLKYLENIDFCTYNKESEYIWVHEMAFDQIAESLDIRDKRVKFINSLFQSLPNLPFLDNFYHQYKDYFHLSPFQPIKAHSSMSLSTQKFPEINSLEAPCKPLRSQEQEQEQKHEQEYLQEHKQEKEQEQTLLSGKPDVSALDSFPFKNKENFYDPRRIDSDALEILDFLNQKTNSNFRPVETNLRLIKSRLISGVTVVQCRQVIAKKIREWRDDPRMKNYLRPATLFNPVNFEQYLGELISVDEGEEV